MRKYLLCLFLLFSMLNPTRSQGSVKAPLGPGFSLEYRVEVLNEGQRRDETLTLKVIEEAAPNAWRLELRLGDEESDLRYQAVYRDGGDSSAFALERFTETCFWDEGWAPVAPADLELLATLSAMEEHLRPVETGADSTMTVGGRALMCRYYSLSDSSEVVQEGESVTIRTNQFVKGDAWICDEVPFGGWVRYREERIATKVSEFGGRSFTGNEERSEETWILVSMTIAE
ncbi:MAG: hypothetical protein GY835_15645 [bacterium]|nr:hypothetical protein [bacterium]